jgi:hypothetical protein
MRQSARRVLQQHTAGRYTFRVIAANNDGYGTRREMPHNYAGAHFYQTIWFYGVCIWGWHWW